MAPNLFLCLRMAFCPVYWFQRGERIQGSIHKEEHWESPIPGIYKYFPGRGWHLICKDGNEHDEKVPVPLVYCRILHRHIFETEMEDRCQWHTVHAGAEPEKFMFFRLDDGNTWVTGWDSKGKFIPGPYQKWYLDSETNTIRHILFPESANVSRCSVLADKMA